MNLCQTLRPYLANIYRNSESSHFLTHVDCYGATNLLTTRDCKRPLNCTDIFTELYTILFYVYSCELKQCYYNILITFFGFTVLKKLNEKSIKWSE